MNPLFGFFEGLLAPSHLFLLLLLGILLFGKRFPEMGRSLGKGFREFRNGFQGLEDEMERTVAPRQDERTQPALEPLRPPQRVATNVPNFEENPNGPTPPA